MKNKYLLLIILIVIVSGAFYFYTSRKKLSLPQNKQSQTQNQNEIKNQNKTNVFNSLKEALAKSQSLKCEFTDNQGRKVTVYLKNNWVRGTYQEVNEMANYLYRDEKMYTWNSNKKEGAVVSINIEQAQKKAEPDKQEIDNDYIKQYEQYKNSCQIVKLPDSLFSPPADVKFQDMSNFQQMMDK